MIMADTSASVSTDLYQQYLTEMGKTPLLKADEERKITSGLEADVAAVRRLVLRSPFALRQVVNWAELIRSGEVDPKELLPRGRPSPARVRSAAQRIQRIAALSRRPQAAYDMIEHLGLSADKIRRLTNRLRDQARRLREGRPTDPLPAPAREVLALDDELGRLERGIDEAKTRLLRANLRLVVSVARHYASSHMELADLIQEGSLGLMRAIERYRPQRGFRFSTYATWWIRQAISRSLSEQERTVRLPSHVQEDIARFRKARVGMERATHVDELAKKLHMPERRVERLLRAMQDTVSLAAPVGEGEEGSLGDLLQDRAEPTPVQRAEDASLRNEVDRWLSTLAPREADLLRLRFGIGTGLPQTLDEVGERFRVTRERARQIQLEALKKLRESPRSEMMREYLS